MEIGKEGNVASNSNPQKLALVFGVILVLAVVGSGSYYLGTKQNQPIVKYVGPRPTVSPPLVSPTVSDNPSQILFEKDEGWGPCPPGGETCTQKTVLYLSGRLVLTGNRNEEKVLSKDVVKQIIAQIRKSGIMSKECSVDFIVTDYLATWKIYLDGQVKTIQSPGCSDELKEIEKLIPDKTPSTMSSGS